MASPLARIFKLVAPHHRLLSFAGYVAALVVVAIFPSFDRRTEIEEHALIPGYASSGFVKEWPTVLSKTIAKVEASADPRSALSATLAEAGLTAHQMNFTAIGHTDASLLYTLAPSRRGDSREAVVLVFATNWTAGKRSAAKAAWGISAGVVLAQYLRTVQWMSKDVFVVFVDNSLPYGAGVRAWLQAYFGGSSAVRRGVLRQAVVVDTPSRPTSVLADVEGINGMVPNQDLVNAYVVWARDNDLAVRHREVWESVFHTFRNGGVHSGHAPFLEFQVPAFTIRGQRKREREVSPLALVRSLEGIARSMSNNLQQLHHSFNFYFFTGPSRHISSGLYLYPVFAMQLPLISFLMTAPAYRDIRSLLVGLGTIVAIVMVTGSPIFLLATEGSIRHWLHGFVSADLAEPPACEHPRWGEASDSHRRQVAAMWLVTGGAAAIGVSLVLRQYAFSVFTEVDPEGSAPEAGVSGRKAQGVQLPSPLWEAVRAASGFAYLVVLAPITIYSWALAMPLTVVVVPVLVLARPLSLRRRPLRSLLQLCFLAGHAFLLGVPPTARASVLGDGPLRIATGAFEFYHRTLVPAVPREMRAYLPAALVRWLWEGQLGASLQSDLLIGLYEAARDFNCVGGMLFPVFCFAYWPLLVVVTLISIVLPAQHVDDDGLTMRQLRIGVLLVLSLVTGGVMGGILWRSYSSAGLGQLQW